MSTPTSWTARVDWTHPHGPNEAELEELVDALAGHDAAVSIDRDDRPGMPAIVSATITLEAGTLRQAIATALQVVEEAAGVKARGVEVLTSAEVDRLLQQPSIPDLVGNAEIADMLDVSRQRAAQLAERDDFPPAVAHLKTGPVRVRRQVEAWIKTWERKGGRPAKAGA